MDSMARRISLGAWMMALALPVAAHAAPWSYDTVVQPLPRPAWMEKVVLICESPWADAGKKTLRPHIKILRDAGFKVMNMYPDGFCRLYAPTAGETWSQECHAEVKAMHDAGMIVLAGCYPTVGERGPRDLLMEHPEWRMRADDKVPPGPGMGCLVSPFGEAVADLLISRVKEYDLDGFQFDGWYQFGYCRCPGCQERYKKETGLAVPPKANLADPAFVKYLAWRDEQLLRQFVRLRTALKAIKPDAVLVQWNNNDLAGACPSGMPEAIDCVADWTNKEWWDSFDVSWNWVMKRIRGAGGDFPPGFQPYMFMRHGIDVESGVYHGSSCPIEEVLFRAHKAMAMGAIPILWPGARQGWTDDDSMKVSRDLADFLPYVHGTKSLKYAACIDSLTTLQSSGLAGRPADENVASPRSGMTRVLLEEHIPFDVISEHNVTGQRLAEYKVIVLPNNFCMSDRLMTLLRDYVHRGGSVVATFETSLFDASGKRRPDFALADLFAASYASSTTIAASRVDFAPQKHPVADDPAIRGLLGSRGYTTYYGKFARVKVAAGAIAPMVGLDVANEKNPALKHWTPLVLSEHGKGRAAYFPAAIDAAYYEAGYPYERMLVANTIRWAASVAPPVKIMAPKCVLGGFYTKAAGKTRQTIVHLLNEINSTTGHGSKNEKQYAIREEVVPIAGVKVAFAGAKPNRVFMVPGNATLTPAATADGWEVSVPELGLHAVVVAEYGS
jgi:hypothetical protein